MFIFNKQRHKKRRNYSLAPLTRVSKPKVLTRIPIRKQDAEISNPSHSNKTRSPPLLKPTKPPGIDFKKANKPLQDNNVSVYTSSTPVFDQNKSNQVRLIYLINKCK